MPKKTPRNTKELAVPTGVSPPSSNSSSRKGSRRQSKDLTDVIVEHPPPEEEEMEEEEQKPDLAAILREMEAEMHSEVQKATAERAVHEAAEREAQEAVTAQRIEEAAAKMRQLNEEMLVLNEDEGDKSVTPDRLAQVRTRRKSKDLTEQAMNLLGESLESTFKAIDLDGSGTLDREECKAAFGKSGHLRFSDAALEPILNDLLDKHGGEINFEQFKSVAWKGLVAAPPESPAACA